MSSKRMKVKKLIMEHVENDGVRTHLVEYVDDLATSYAELQNAHRELIAIHQDMQRRHYQPRQNKVKVRNK